MTKTGSVGKRAFQKGGKRGEKNTNLALLPSTRGRLLVRKLEEDEDKMADWFLDKIPDGWWKPIDKLLCFGCRRGCLGEQSEKKAGGGEREDGKS